MAQGRNFRLGLISLNAPSPTAHFTTAFVDDMPAPC
jgi:hypothetical protein